MICTSLQGKNLEDILGIMDDPFVEMAEVRADLNPLDEKDWVELVETCEKPLIFSFHIEPSLRGEEKSREWNRMLELYNSVIESGISFVDLDINAPVHMSQSIQKLCKHSGTRLIRSFHDFDGTPTNTLLQQTILRCFRYGADIAKIACKANCAEDVANLQGIYDTLLENNHSIQAHHLVLISMGPLGEKARVECIAKGAPSTTLPLPKANYPTSKSTRPYTKTGAACIRATSMRPARRVSHRGPLWQQRFPKALRT